MRNTQFPKALAVACLAFTPLLLEAQEAYSVKNGAVTKNKTAPNRSSIAFAKGDLCESKGLESTGVLGFLPEAFKLGRQWYQSHLEKKLKQYVWEDEEFATKDPKVNDCAFPVIQYRQEVRINGTWVNGLSFDLRPVNTGQQDFYLQLENLRFDHAIARLDNKGLEVDLLIEPVLSIFTVEVKEGEQVRAKNELKLKPMLVKGLVAGGENGERKAVLSERFTLGKQVDLAEVNLKVTETNPSKVRTERLLQLIKDGSENLDALIGKIAGGDEE